ncbi:MAG: dihydroneopterin aldolase [Bacteroidia bacterium]|nr:dihydroneopterin aldolase [Bacteroidia bacterium]
MHKINVEGIKVYAYHGCLEEEARIGQEYSVDVYMETDFTEAAQTDELSKTIDYCQVFEIVKLQMKTRSNLIEHVARRIKENLLKDIAAIKSVKVKVTKFNPPMNGNVERVSVEI